MPSAEPALFRAYPELRDRWPRQPALAGRTPVEPFPLPGAPRGSLYVKRDDGSCPLYGGNKPRKLEFAIGAARARGARRIVTSGALGTHHGLATTILAREAGLATTLVLIHQPVTAEVVRALLLDVAYGAELVYGANVPGSALQLLRVLAMAAVRGEKPALVPPGGSSTEGNVGFASAAFELAEQVREGELPEPAEVWVAVGTGGTLAGLLAGLKLAGLATRAVGVLVTDILPPSERRLVRAARRVVRRLRRSANRVPDVAIGPEDLELLRGQLGAGYGAATPAAHDAVAAAAACGLQLETTYTGKCLAALHQRVREGRLPEGPVLFWNTYNAVDVAARAPRPLDPAALPPRFRRFLDDVPEAARPTPLGAGSRSRTRSERQGNSLSRPAK